LNPTDSDVGVFRLYLGKSWVGHRGEKEKRKSNRNKNLTMIGLGKHQTQKITLLSSGDVGSMWDG
jgi:hypothetical protein